MKIKVIYFGQLRQIAGVGEEERDAADDATVQDVALACAQQHGEEFASVVVGDGGLRPSLMALVNGSAIDKSAPVNLCEGDEVTLLAAIAGG